MQKIFELKGQDWMRGLSVQTGMALGGLFQSATGFNPFETIGFMQPSLSYLGLTAPVTNPVKAITHWNDGTTGYLYAHSESKLYRYLRLSPYTQLDVTAEVTFSATGADFSGGLLWRGSADSVLRYIYANSDEIRSNTLPVAIAADKQILSAGHSELDIRKMCIGADKNLYIPYVGGVNKCVTNDSTSGNVVAAFAIDKGYTVRDLLNDGRYLVIFADNNTISTTSRLVGTYSCRAYFWDMAKNTADVIWDFPGESYLIGAAYLDGAIIVFGYNGIYVCNSVTPPKMIASFLGNSTLTRRPANPYQITSDGSTVFWGDGASVNTGIYAYGSLPGSNKKIFYTPYVAATTNAITALSSSANLLFAAHTTPSLVVYNTGSTRGDASVLTTPIQLEQPFRYGYTKIVLKDKLSSGQSVTFKALTAGELGGLVVSDQETKSYSASNPRKDFKFEITPATNSVSVIEDLVIQVTGTAGATIERVTIYGEPLPDANANL